MKALKQNLFLFICILFPLIAHSQISGTGYTVNFNPPFESTTETELKSYFNNAYSLDPIEGLYDVEWTNHFIYKEYGERHSTSNYTCGIVKNGNFYYFYVPYNKKLHPQGWLVIENIGNTPLYNFCLLAKSYDKNHKYMISKQRIPFEDFILWTYSHKFTDEEQRYIDPEFAAKVISETRVISAIKTYPNSSTSISGSWSGTGFALRDKFIVTNFHVVNNASEILVYGVNGDINTGYPAEIVSTDKNNDLALIRIADRNLSSLGNIPYSLSTKSSNVGEDIFVLGYPLTSSMGDEIKLTNGIISSKTGYQGDVSTYQISAPIQPGNSGGPLFDSKGNIVGIVVAKHTQAENAGYAIKVSYLFNMLDAASLSNIQPNNNTVSQYSLSEKVKRLKKFVYIIKCR